MLHSSIAFKANPFQKFVIRQKVRMEFDSPWPGVGFGIAQRDFQVHVPEVAPPQRGSDSIGRLAIKIAAYKDSAVAFAIASSHHRAVRHLPGIISS